jgi:ketosteroid isomerase-like protein
MYIYEHSWPGLAVAAILLVIFIWFHEFNLRKIKLSQWSLVLIIALGSVALNYFVRTDNEKIRNVIAKIVRAAQNEDVEAIGKCVTDNYHDSFNENKIAFLDHARARLTDNLIEKNVLSIISVDIHIPSASSIFTVRVLFDPRGQVYDFQKQMIFKLEARLTKQADGSWLINRLEVTEVDMHPVNWQNIVNSLGDAID